MVSPRNPYQVLNIRPTATTDEVRRAYRRLALDCHPDRHPGDPEAAVRFRELTVAYNTLSDPGKRREVDGLLRSFWRQLVRTKSGAPDGAQAAHGNGHSGANGGGANGNGNAAREVRATVDRNADRRKAGGFFDALFGTAKGVREPASPPPPPTRGPRPATAGAGGNNGANGTAGNGAAATPPREKSPTAEEARRPVMRPGADAAARGVQPDAYDTPTEPHGIRVDHLRETPPSAKPAAAQPQQPTHVPPRTHSPTPTPTDQPSPQQPAARAATPRPAAKPASGGGAVPLERGESRMEVVEIPFQLACVGGHFPVELKLDFACSICEGSGSAEGAERPVCPDCGGSGERPLAASAEGGDPAASSVCPRCVGRGHLVTVACPTCDGTGSQTHTRRYRVAVPPCMPELHRLRIEGDGEPGRAGGPPGDLILVLRAARHPTFHRRGRDIHGRVTINLAQAAFGDTIEVETLHGGVSLDIPAGTQPGAVFRLPGWGVGGARGVLTDADGMPDTPQHLGDPDDEWEAAAAMNGAQAAGGHAAPVVGAASDVANAPGDHYIHIQVEVPALERDTDKKRFFTMAKSLKMFDAMTFPPEDPKPPKRRKQKDASDD